MKIESVLIGAALIGLVFVIGLNLLVETASNYSVATDTDNNFGKITSDLESSYKYGEDMKEKVQGGAITDENAVDEMVAGGFKGIKYNPLRAASVVTNTSTAIMKETGLVDANIIRFVTYTVMVLVLLAVVLFIFRLIPSSR